MIYNNTLSETNSWRTRWWRYKNWYSYNSILPGTNSLTYHSQTMHRRNKERNTVFSCISYNIPLPCWRPCRRVQPTKWEKKRQDWKSEQASSFLKKFEQVCCNSTLSETNSWRRRWWQKYKEEYKTWQYLIAGSTAEMLHQSTGEEKMRKREHLVNDFQYHLVRDKFANPSWSSNAPQTNKWTIWTSHFPA